MTSCSSIEIHIFQFHLFHNFFFLTINLFAFVSLLHVFMILFHQYLHISLFTTSSHFVFNTIFTFLFHWYIHDSFSQISSFFLFSSPCQRQRELLPSLGIRRCRPSVNFSPFNLFLGNPLAK